MKYVYESETSFLRDSKILRKYPINSFYSYSKHNLSFNCIVFTDFYKSEFKVNNESMCHTIHFFGSIRQTIESEQLLSALPLNLVIVNQYSKLLS
jgi:hypothetical protein